MIRAVLFDMDGVLYHTMPSHAKAWLGSMAKCGLSMSEEEVYRYEGMIGTETMERLKRATDEGSLGWGWLSLNITPKIFTTKW